MKSVRLQNRDCSLVRPPGVCGWLREQ
jgi:hypothetical protein